MTTNDILEENRRIRLLRISSDMLIDLVLTRTPPYAEVEDMINGVRSLANHLFPGKDHVFELIYMPRFRRALREAGYHRDCELRLVSCDEED
jgi:hypothetical protein